MKKLSVLFITILFATTLLSQKGTIIFTKAEYPNFDAAKPHAIKEVKDGDPLWMNIKLDKPLKNYTFTDDVIKKSSPAEPNLIVIAIGPSNDKETEWGTEEFYFPDSQLDKNFLSINLAPGFAGKNKSSGVFLNLISGGSPGVWSNSIRVYAPSNEREETDFGSRPKKNYIAIGTITANVADGFDAYKKQKGNYYYVKEKGTASENKVPVPGRFVDNKIKSIMLAALKNKNINPAKFFFTSDDWTIQSNWSTGVPEWNSVFGVAIYKEGNECKYAEVGVSYKYNPLTEQWSKLYPPVVKDGYPIDCSKIK